MKHIVFVYFMLVNIILAKAQITFTGGTSDGWSTTKTLQSSDNIFTGGNSDGYATAKILQASDNIFTGGTSDGWATVKTFTGSNIYVCAAGSTALPAMATGNTYEWQANTGAGFQDINNGVNYAGATTASLQLKNIPSSYYGYQYRCIINGAAGAVYVLKIAAYWTGSVNTAWENTGNWGCGQLPDANTDVFIFGGKSRYPVINTSTSCRSVNANATTTVTIVPGISILLTGKSQ